MRKEDWIKVEDRLPETQEIRVDEYKYKSSDKVLALEEGITPLIVKYEKGNDFEQWIIADEPEAYQIEVTHWQEIVLP